MIARVKTNRLFSGKIYGKNQPNSCVNDINESLDFEINMPFNGMNCNLVQTSPGAFENDIVIQHHDLIVTNKDLGLNIQCLYEISNRSVTSSLSFGQDSDRLDFISSCNLLSIISFSSKRNSHYLFFLQRGCRTGP